ncbi:MAG: hypothetical protein HOO99_11965, partial [Hyphomicrobiaceae bacterium]|nr:hypothetical protein [Hyphomicrobiaceae bacterium]
MSNKPRLFIAIATEERIANIPPILEMKNTNEDQILWLVSSEAKNKNWVDKPSELLKNLGVTSFAKVVEVEDDPDDCAKAVAAELEKAIYSRFEKVLVGNGGQKPTLLALSHALPQGTPLIYGQAQPAELWFWGQGIRGGKQRIPYRKARLTLDEVLACRGYKKMSNNAKQFWPAAAAAAVQNNIDWMDCSAGQYGIDHDTTLKAHQRYRTLAALPDTKDGKINPRAAEHLLPDEFNAWKTQMLEACASRNGTNQQQLTALFFLAQAVAKKARGVRDASKNKNESEQNGIGRAFELAVARRVRGWLTDRAREITNFPVLEAWWNTEIKRIGSST